MFRSSFASGWLVVFALGVGACGGDDGAREKAACDPDAQTGCAGGQICEVVEEGEPACFAPVLLKGRVIDAASGEPVSDAIVAARDVNGALISRGLATTDAAGRYVLSLPAQRSRDGTPRIPSASLRADASGYRTFPGGLRVALPVDTTRASSSDGAIVVENESTDVALDALVAQGPVGTIRGYVRADDPAGTLVVAGAASGIASNDGSFTLFNVAAGSAEVRGYKAGVQLSSAQVDVVADGVVEGVELVARAGSLARVSGDVSFVNARAQQTSVVLVVESTFDESLARGEVPIGLRLFPVGGHYELVGVPDGRYVVLAAFENDDLVRDPDTSIGGTAVQRITVAGADVGVPGFKITGALAVMEPGADKPDVVTGTPTFVWEDDSSEDGYELVVYDTFGNLVWRDTAVPRVTGSATVSYAYSGPALARGYYQFRAISFREPKNGGRTYISSTEDLKGVFVVP